MSTTIVAQVTGEPGTDMAYQRFVVVTVREDDVLEEMQAALLEVSQDAVLDEDEDVDEIELRASVSSELRAAGLQLTELRTCGYGFLGA